jgi:hypothetical protein
MVYTDYRSTRENVTVFKEVICKLDKHQIQSVGIQFLYEKICTVCDTAYTQKH